MNGYMKNPGTAEQGIPRFGLQQTAEWLMILMVFAFGPVRSGAHPISMSTTLANIQTNRVSIEMGILIEDLVLYHELKPGENFLISASDLKSAAETHQEFLLKYFMIRDLDGHLLKGTVDKMDISDIPEEGVNAGDLMAHSVIYNIDFPLTSPPEFLSFSQTFGGVRSVLPAIMDLIVFQEGIRTQEPVKILPNIPHVVEFNWDESPQPLPNSWRERKKLREDKKSRLLGITSYSSIYSFIYLTDFEVRHEVLIPLITLETLLPLERADPDFLEIEEQHNAQDRLLEFFAENNPVEIDGIQVRPLLDRLDFYGLNFKDFSQKAPEQRVSMHNGRIGAILSFPTKGSPRHIKMGWKAYTRDIPFLRTIVFEKQKDAELAFFEPSEPSVEWNLEPTKSAEPINLQKTPPPLPKLQFPIATLLIMVIALILFMSAFKVPHSIKRISLYGTVCILLLGAYLTRTIWIHEVKNPWMEALEITESEATSIFSSLHRNVYRSFDYRTEEAIYEALSRSVEGELLTDLYLKILEGLKVQEQGGAVSRVDEVEILESSMLPATDQTEPNDHPFFRYACNWTVKGTVEHWGHIHTRKNQYQADFLVEASPDGWKINEFQVHEEKRLEAEISLRQFR